MSKVKCFSKQNTVDTDLLDGVCTARTLHKKASQQRIAAHAKNVVMLLPDKAPIDTKFYKFLEDMQAKTDSIQASLYY